MDKVRIFPVAYFFFCVCVCGRLAVAHIRKRNADAGALSEKPLLFPLTFAYLFVLERFYQ